MLLCASYCIRLLRLQFYDFSVNYEGLLSTIEPFDGTNFPKWNKEVHAVLKVLGLDYALCEDEPIAPAANAESYDEQIRKFNSNLEKWKHSNKLGKMIINQSISVAIRGVLPCIKNDGELSAKEFLNSIEENYEVDYANFLINKSCTSHYDGQNGSMYDMAAELKTRSCKFCQSPGHIMKQCPEFKEWIENKGNKVVS